MQKFLPELTVVKIGGSLLHSKMFAGLVRSLSDYLRKHKTVIVHGGGKEINDLSARLGIRSRFVQGRRYTDKQTMEVVEMALSGKVNPCLVSQMNRSGIAAVGLSGRQAKLIQATRIKSLGYVGVPSAIKKNLILRILSLGCVPVFASVASTRDGGALNVNADEMAAAMAIALQAKRLILFTDVPGILDRAGKTIRRISFAEGKKLIENNVVSGGMIPKIKSALNALKNGVQEIWIIQGKLPLRQAEGTLLTKNPISPKQRHPFG